MQKLIIATIGLSLSLGVAATAVAQSAGTPAPMQGAQGTAGDSTTNPSAGTAPPPSSAQSDPSMNSGTAAPGAAPSGGMAPGGTSSGGMSSGSMGNMAPPPAGTPQSYPKCSAKVHDECRQRS